MSDPRDPADATDAAGPTESTGAVDSTDTADAPAGRSDGSGESTPGSRPAADAAFDLPSDVPEGAETAVCRYCGRPFLESEYLVLHRGLAHYEALTDAEREAFAEAYGAEEGNIRHFRFVALGVLILLYFGFLILYASFATV